MAFCDLLVPMDEDTSLAELEKRSAFGARVNLWRDEGFGAQGRYTIHEKEAKEGGNTDAFDPSNKSGGSGEDEVGTCPRSSSGDRRHAEIM